MALFQYITLFLAILLFIFYHIWRRHKNVVIPNWPIVGMLPSIIYHQSNIHDYATLLLKHYGGTFHCKGLWFTNIANFIITTDTMNVNYILSRNFKNYGKGSDFHDIFEILGVGIFNLDASEWKQERSLLQSLLKMKNMEIFHQENIQKKLENCLLPYLDHASKGIQVIDLQDIMLRFTFDITCTFLFGFDPNSLPYKCNEFTYIAIKAISIIEEVLLSRHYIPKCIWKLQKWLQFGQEKNTKAAEENLHKFIDKCILKSNEYVDESHSFLVKYLMKQEKSDKYIRDTALNLLAAGNGAVGAGLSWFFWLIATHPIVEARIIQEMKDNFLRAEDLDNLVYLHGAICESLRLYPPLPFEQKCAIKSDILPSGDHVSPNKKLIYSLYAMGRMEQIWGKDCMEFNPERWISDRGEIIHVPSYKFITFNSGSRTCIGKDITFVLMKMVAASVLRNFHIQVVEGHSVTPGVAIVLRMKYGLKVNVTQRFLM